MSNMSYCRFENTAHDLQDCAAHINDKLSESENGFRKQLVHLCADILEQCGLKIPDGRAIEEAMAIVEENAE